MNERKESGKRPVFETGSIINDAMTNVMPTTEAVVNRVKAQKKISTSEEVMYDVVDTLLKVISYFNSLPEHTTMVFDNVDIKDVSVMKEFADFVVPSAIRFDVTDLRARDLSFKDGVLKSPISYVDYINYCDMFRAFFKKDTSSEMVPLTDLKKSVSLVSVISRASSCADDSVPYRVCYGSEVYYPIRINDVEKLYEDRHFNDVEASIMKDYLAVWKL